MVIETSRIIIDDDLEMDVNTGVIGQKVSRQVSSIQSIPIEEVMQQIDKLDEAITDLESSFDSNTTSRLSQPNREGTYQKAGLLTNIVLGVIIALVLIILLI